MAKATTARNLGGRPRAEHPRSGRNFRASDVEWEQYEAAARIYNQRVHTWLREQLNADAAAAIRARPVLKALED